MSKSKEVKRTPEVSVWFIERLRSVNEKCERIKSNPKSEGFTREDRKFNTAIRQLITREDRKFTTAIRQLMILYRKESSIINQ